MKQQLTWYIGENNASTKLECLLSSCVSLGKEGTSVVLLPLFLFYLLRVIKYSTAFFGEIPAGLPC